MGILIGASGVDSRAASGLPALGAEVYVEPGNTHQQIDGWMKVLGDNHMPLARVFIMSAAVQPTHGQWNFTLYDDVFASAQQHGVGILATLDLHYPVRNSDQQEQNNEYIARVVERYKTNSALDSWLLVNEPGHGPGTDELAIAGFRAWLENKYQTIESLNRAWSPRGRAFESFAEVMPETSRKGWECANWADWITYGRAYQTRQLENISKAVSIHDQAHQIHVNPHALMGNLAAMSDNLPAWRPFLTSLGASLHPAWHFGLLRSRDQFPLGVSYICDLIRGASEPQAFWVTELQGGNNIYSGTRPLYPDAKDIGQWLWVSLGSGADRVIFWLLNARESGTEAGEWSLLDLQGRSSERLQAAADVVKVLEKNREFFAGARPVEPPIAIILSLETMTLQLRYGDANAHLREALGLYEALNDLGIPARIKHFDDYPWRLAASNQVVILPHVSSISAKQAEDLAAFVADGNRAFVTGLTGFFDPLSHVWPMRSFPLAEVLGGNLKEVRYLGSTELVLDRPALRLPVADLVADIDNISGLELGAGAGRVIATSKMTGTGQTIWIPSLVGNGAWFGDHAPITDLLKRTLKDAIHTVPFRFADRCPGLVLRTLRNGNAYVTIIANGSGTPASCRLAVPPGFVPSFLVGNKRELVKSQAKMEGHETLVVMWKHLMQRKN